VWAGFVWLRIGSSGRLSWTREWTFGSHEWHGIFSTTLATISFSRWTFFHGFSLSLASMVTKVQTLCLLCFSKCKCLPVNDWFSFYLKTLFQLYLLHSCEQRSSYSLFHQQTIQYTDTPEKKSESVCYRWLTRYRSTLFNCLDTKSLHPLLSSDP
jgi:hypothetical protein